MTMAKFYGTFGSCHFDRKGLPLYGNYVEIEAQTYGEARAKMFAARGHEWSFVYTAEEFKGKPTQFNLARLELNDVWIEGSNEAESG